MLDHRPIHERDPLVWPNGARLAFAIVVNFEHYELDPPSYAVQPLNLPGPYGRAPYPDVRAFSHREYGNRVGIFRVLDILDHLGLKATAAIDSWTAMHRHNLVGEIKRRNWDVAGHGQAVTQLVSEAMSEAEERTHITFALEALEAAFGQRPLGWHGPEYGESTRTPAILCELGVKYLLDWPNDEQPYRIRTSAGPIIAIPMMVELDDVFAHWYRRISMQRWKQSLIDAVDQMRCDGARTGRVLVLNLHPWLIGQPYRSTYLKEALAEITAREGIWFATCREIAEWAESHLPQTR